MSTQIDVQNLEIRHNTAENRFEATLGEDLAVLDYTLRGNLITYTHTGVPDAYEGQGIGGKLTHTGLEYAKANNYQILPLCPFVAHYVETHPEYQGLLVS